MMRLMHHEIDREGQSASLLAMSVRLLRYVVGTLFVCSGIAKLPMVHTFAATLAAITHLPEGASWILGLLIVALEIAGGTTLLLRFTVYYSAPVLCILTAVFLWVLSSAILQGKEITCNCFGVLGIRFPNRIELVLDLVIFDSLAFIFWASSPRRLLSSNHTRPAWFLTFVTVIAVLYVEFALLQRAFGQPADATTAALRPAIRFAEVNTSGFASLAGPYRVLFVISVNDFNCPPCFDDFVMLCDSISARLPPGDRERVVALVRPDNPIASHSPTRLNEWTRATGILFPVLVAPDTLFTSLGFRKSFISVINSSGDVIVRQDIPAGVRQRELVMNYLLQ